MEQRAGSVDQQAKTGVAKIIYGERCASEPPCLSQSEDDRLKVMVWARKNAFPAIGRISPDYYCIDGTIPSHTNWVAF